MKRFVAILIIVLSATVTQAYTFDSWFDPAKLFQCPGSVIDEAVIDGKMFQRVCVVCDDKLFDIVVQLLKDGNTLLISYRYKDRGIEYLFILQGDHYKQVEPKNGKNI
jgi:hypothetical protein